MQHCKMKHESCVRRQREKMDDEQEISMPKRKQTHVNIHDVNAGTLQVRYSPVFVYDTWILECLKEKTSGTAAYHSHHNKQLLLLPAFFPGIDNHDHG